jgi:drug/metabolite transporter (DMT)-like permease
MQNLSSNLKGIILAIIGFSAFAMTDATVKFLSLEYHVLEILFWEAAFAVMLSILLSPWLGGLARTFRTKRRKIHLGRSLCNTAIGVLVTFAFAKLPLATCYTLIFVAPFVTTLLAVPVYKEKISRHCWLAIIAGFSGVLLVLRPGFAEIDPWLLLPLLSTLFIAGLFLFARALPEDESLHSLAFYPALSSVIFMAPFTVVLGHIPDWHALALFALAGSGVVLGLITTAMAFRIAKASVVSPLHYSQMLWAIGFGYVLFGDIPDIWTVAGATIIIGSGLYLISHERKAAIYGPDHL